MKIELATIVASKQEIPWLDFGLESILDTTKHDINTTIYLARYTDEMFEDCAKLANKYNVRSVPTTVIEENGIEIDRFVGATSKHAVLNRIS